MRDRILFVGALLALCVDGWGCAEWPDEPPEHYSISDEFSTAERDVIRAAVGEWCDATGHCPTEALWSERGRFEPTDDRVPTAWNDSDAIWVARHRKWPDDMAYLHTVVSHEWGHFCAPHTAHGLMADPVHGPWPVAIDAEAVAAWHAGCPGF